MGLHLTKNIKTFINKRLYQKVNLMLSEIKHQVFLCRKTAQENVVTILLVVRDCNYFTPLVFIS